MDYAGRGAVVVLFQAIAGDSHSWSPASSSPDASLPDHVQPVRYRSVTLQAHHRASGSRYPRGAQPPHYARWPALSAGYPTSRHAAAIKPSESAVTCLRVATCPPRALSEHCGLDSAFVGSGSYRPGAAVRVTSWISAIPPLCPRAGKNGVAAWRHAVLSLTRMV